MGNKTNKKRKKLCRFVALDTAVTLRMVSLVLAMPPTEGIVSLNYHDYHMLIATCRQMRAYEERNSRLPSALSNLCLIMLMYSICYVSQKVFWV